MRAALGVVVAAVLASACEGTVPPPPYSNSELQLLTGFYARMTCSCRFVMGQGEEFCRNWVRQQPEVTQVSVDERARTVSARIAEVWHQQARFVSERRGCVLE